MIRAIHHVGVVVNDLAEGIRVYGELGLGVAARGRSAGEAMEYALLRGGEAEVELMRPEDETSSMGRFLTQRGPGLHHVAYAVPDLRRALAELQGSGFQPAGEIRTGVHGARIAFLHPKSVGGVLTELVEVDE